MTTSAKRLDSAARRAQLLDVADRVFTAHGVHAPLDLIVEMAGVGRATLYRQFPDRHMLLLALMERSAQWLATRARRLAHRDDAFFRLLDYMASRIVRSPALSDYWRTTRMSDPRFSDVYQEVLNAFAPPVARAQRAGLLHADVRADDIPLLASMLAAGLRGETDAERRQLVGRALCIVQRGLTPSAPGGCLPGMVNDLS